MANKPKAEQKSSPHPPSPVATGVADADTLRREIELRAYHRYCERGCADGADEDDWRAAEQEVLAGHLEPEATATKVSG